MKSPFWTYYFLSAIIFTSCGQENSSKQFSSASGDKILIVFLSRTKNTKTVAEIIHEKTKGDLVGLELVHPYPKDYKEIVAQVAEENDKGFLPPLKTNIDLKKYDTIFLGFPTWGMQLPPPIKSFLANNDLSGKTVIPFNTNAGYGVGSSFKTVTELCKNCIIKEGFTTTGGIERDGIYLAIKDLRKKEVEQEITQWLSEIGITENK